MPGFELPAIETALAIPSEIEKLILSGQQRRQADALARIKRPAFDIPSAANEALLRARYRALATQLPGQKQLENKLGAQTAGGIRFATETASSPVDALATGAAMIGKQQDTLGNLGVEAANMFDRNQQLLTNQLGSYATWQDKANEWNKYQPYLQAKQAEAALRYGTQANQYSGTKGVLGAIAGGVQLADEKGLFNGIGGGNTPTSTATGGTNTSNIFNQPSTTAPQNYPFENAFPTSIPINPNNMGGGNMRDTVSQRFMQRYGRMPSEQELTQLGY